MMVGTIVQEGSILEMDIVRIMVRIVEELRIDIGVNENIKKRPYWE